MDSPTAVDTIIQKGHWTYRTSFFTFLSFGFVLQCMGIYNSNLSGFRFIGPKKRQVTQIMSNFRRGPKQEIGAPD